MATPHFYWLETQINLGNDEVFRTELKFAAGRFSVPDAPGLGIEVVEENLYQPFR